MKYQILTAVALGLVGLLQAQTVPTPPQTDEIIIDTGAPGKADPGDRIRYKVTIQNTGGSNANGAQLNIVPDPRTTFVPGSFRSSPLALPDAYACTGNVGISVPAASGLLANDFDDNPAGLTATIVANAATTQGGSITIAADGSFSYTPPAGFTGNDTYTYTLNDGNPVTGVTATDMSTVTFTVSNMIWFVDNTGGGSGGTGALSNPFKTLGDFNASAGPLAGHLVFIRHTGTNYGGGIVLKDNMTVFGSGHTGGANLADVLPFSLAANSLPLPAINGTRPVITNASGDGVTLASGNTLRGFDVGACSDFGMENSGTNSVGNLVLSEVSINNTTGGGFDASHGSGAGMNAVFTSISSSGGVNGINLTNCMGTFTVNGGTITNPTGTGILVSGGSVTVSCAAAVSDNTGFAVDVDNHDSNNVTFSGNITSTGTGIRVQNCNGGTKTFSGSSKTLNTATNTAVTLSSNTSATINFTGGGLAITTTSGTGFNATGGATAITVQGTGNTINSTSGATALNVANTTIGASNLNFQSISSNGGSATGIILDNTGSSGGLVVNGDGSNTTTGGNSTGGTITGKTGANGQTTTGIGIYLNNTRNVVLRRMTLNGTKENFGIRGNSVVNFTMEYCTVGGSNGNSDINDEASIRFTELTGTATVTGCIVSGGYEDNLKVINTAANTLTANISTTTFGLATTQTALELNDGVNLETLTGAAIINATISNCIFRSAAGDLFQWNQNGTGNCSLTLQNCTFTNNHGAIATGGGGVSLFTNGTSNVTMTVSGNTFRDAIGVAVLIVKSTGTSTLSGTFSNNTIGVAAAANSGSSEGSALKIQSTGQGTVTMAVSNNSIYQYNNHGIEILTGGGAMAFGGNMNVTITGNTISNPGNTPGVSTIAKNGIHLNGGTVPGDTYQICLDIGGAGALANNLVGAGKPGDGPVGGQDFRLRQRQSTTVRLPGYGGSATDAAAVIAYIQGRNNGVPTGDVSFNSPPGGGYVGGAVCNTP